MPLASSPYMLFPIPVRYEYVDNGFKVVEYEFVKIDIIDMPSVFNASPVDLSAMQGYIEILEESGPDING